MRIRPRSFKLASFVCACIAGTILQTQAGGGLRVGNSFPDLSAFNLEGKLPVLKGKIVVVDFWASWCGPCRASFPVMDALQKKYGPGGLIIVAVNEDAKKKDMEAFLKERNLTFTVVRDAAPDGKKLIEKVEVEAMPSSFVIDAEGVVRFVHSGFHGNETQKAYEKEIESLLPKSK